MSITRERVTKLQETWGDDPFPDGSIIAFEKKFSSGDRHYTYAAVKGGGKFYLTTGATLAWFPLLDFMEEDNELAKNEDYKIEFWDRSPEDDS